MPGKSQFRRDIDEAAQSIGLNMSYHKTYNDNYRSGSRRIKFCGVKTTHEEREKLQLELAKKYPNVVVNTTTRSATGMYPNTWSRRYFQGLSVRIPA